jgi:hypothetical protein
MPRALSVALVTAVATLCAVATLFAGATGTAVADPTLAPQSFIVPLACDDGQAYEAVVNGRGGFTAAHDLDGTRILVPVALGPFHGVVEDLDGNPLFTFTEPGVSKGSSSNVRLPLVTCTYTTEFTGFDPELGIDVAFVGRGSITAFVTPVRRVDGS